MKDIPSAVKLSAAEKVRAPESKLVLRDVQLRLTNWVTNAWAVDYPSLRDGDDVPQCPIDMMERSGTMYRVWATGNFARLHTTQIDNAGGWASGSGTYYDMSLNGLQRVGITRHPTLNPNQARVFRGVNGVVQIVDFEGASVVFTTDWGTTYSVADDHVAFASPQGQRVYQCALNVNGPHRFLWVKRITASTETSCPHAIIVDEGYNRSSLQWFDAVQLGDKDIIVANSRKDGLPVAITYQDGVWSDPKPLIPLDIVDGTNNIRISHLTVIDGVIWATGRISRGGSTGSYMQSCDITLRSKDGEHWSIDRYSYLGSSEQRGKLCTYGDHCYHPGGAVVRRGDLTWLMGGDPEDAKLEIDDDILEWGLALTEAGSENQANTVLAAQHGLYDPDGEDPQYSGRHLNRYGDMAIFPGLWLWREAGYNGEREVISVEGVDITPRQYAAGNRRFSFRSRDVVWRMLRDWAADQDWQWLSQNKHYDDCKGLVDKLYSVSRGHVELMNAEGERVVLEEDELEEEGARQVFQAYNKPLIAFTTQPSEAKNFMVKARFSPDNDSGSGDVWQHGLGFDLDPARTDQRLGHGFGVVGCAFDQYNLIAAYVDMITGKLYLLYRGGDEWHDGYGTKEDNKWYELANVDLTGTEHFKRGEIFEVKLIRNGRRLIATCHRFSSSGTPTRSAMGALFHDWGEPHKMVRHGDEEYSGWSFDRGKLGVICNINVPETRVMHVHPGEHVIARSLDQWPDPPYDGWFDDNDWRGFSAQDTYQWFIPTDGANGPWLYIGDERLEVTKVTQSDWRSRYYFHNTSVIFNHQDAEEHPETEGFKWRSRWFASLGDGPYHTEAPGDYAHGFRYHGPGTYDPNQEPVNRWWKEGDPYDTGQDLNGHLFVILDGPGTGVTAEIARHSIPGDVADPWWPWEHWEQVDPDPDWDQFYVRLNAEQWASTTGAQTSTWGGRACYWMCMPGFHVAYRGDPDIESDPGGTHPRSTVARQHSNDRIVLEGVWAYDDEHDKTLEWVLKDITSKAGVLDFETKRSVDTTTTGYLKDIDGQDLFTKDFDMTFLLTSTLAPGEALRVRFRLPTKSLSGFGLSMNYYNDGGNMVVRLFQQTDETGWVLVDQHPAVSGTRIRVVAKEHFVTVYVNGAQAPTLCAGPIYGYGTDGWSERLLEAGYVNVASDSTVTITQPQLWAWKEVAIMDSRNNALSGMDRAIEDMRVKFVSTLKYPGAIPALRIGYGSLDKTVGDIESYAHFLGTFRDQVEPHDDKHLSIFTDSVSENDRIPTHVRVIGTEISDYIDHQAAAKYGLNFVAFHCPSLEEKEGYEEAKRIVRDALSHAGARQPTAAAQMEWEPEDVLELIYVPHDEGPSVSGYYIVHANQLRYTRAAFECRAVLREFV